MRVSVGEMPRRAASSWPLAALPMRAHAAGVRAGQDRIGAAGIISAVLQYYMNFIPRSGSRDVDSFLLAAAVSALCKKNASISGAEVGCQVEVGSACALAAARLAEVSGGMPAQVENAAEIGLEHNLALRGDGAHAISLDQVIRTMRDTGRDMLDNDKETFRGGLAVSLPECGERHPRAPCSPARAPLHTNKVTHKETDS